MTATQGASVQDAHQGGGRAPRSARSVIGSYVALTKPRIIELLLITTIPTMFLAAGGFPSLWLILNTMIGGYLAAGGANTLNMYLERDIDAKMKRTENRPLVTGEITPRAGDQAEGAGGGVSPSPPSWSMPPCRPCSRSTPSPSDPP